MRRALKSVRRFVVVAFVRVTGAAFGLLPPRAARRLGRCFGAVAFRLSRRDSRRAIENLETAYGDEISEAERRRIARASISNLCGSMFELFSLSWRGPAGVMKLVGPDEDVSALEKPIAEGRGVLLFSAHINNWMISGYLQKQAPLGWSVDKKTRQGSLINSNSSKPTAHCTALTRLLGREV